MNATATLDLILLVPGKDERETFDELLASRSASLRIRPVRYQILVHPRRDPGCFHEGPDVLQPYCNRARYSLIVLDHEGSGQEDRAPDEVAADLKDRMEQNGWPRRAEVLVLQPELENWVWSDSRHVDEVTGWAGREPPLWQWIRDQGWWPAQLPKPSRPKEAFEAALRHVRTRRSAALYRQLAERVSLERCRDEEFQRFKKIMQTWFPCEGS